MQAADFLRDKRAMPTVNVILAMTETIRRGQAGSETGTMYAMLCGKVSLDGYNQAVALIKRTGLVAETAAHELVWTGPELTA